MAKIFDIKGRTAIPTELSSQIWYLQDIIDEYGVETSGKIFYFFHCMYDLNPETNPFADKPEPEKKEAIIRATCPELFLTLDLDSPLIENAMELVKELYETPNYRIYKAFKKLLDKLSFAIDHVHVSLSKEDGNSGEIKKATEMYDDIKMKYSSSYKELQEEMEIKKRRGGAPNSRSSGKSKDLPE